MWNHGNSAFKMVSEGRLTMCGLYSLYPNYGRMIANPERRNTVPA
jgi:hypothetical protein